MVGNYRLLISETCDISSFYEELENDLDQKTKEIIEKVIDKIENDAAYKELKKKDIKLIIYNNRKKVIKDKLLENEIEV
jgi:ATP-dependent protease HslVU (ClpYQ) peptidase subunit